ncbi:MAG: leucine-rich repeat protein [Lachnospiraceae bacterium]|nr:leucine-rich repeat protein [Lachnospiraceae bacterium]
MDIRHGREKKAYRIYIVCMIMMFLCIGKTGIIWADTQTTEEVYSGTCGENVTWYLDEEKCMTISGTGDMENYGDTGVGYNAPWYDYADTITKVVIEEGVTSVGAEAFVTASGIKEVIIPDSVTAIYEGAFWGCFGLEQVTFGEDSKLTHIKERGFCQCTSLESIVLPDGITRIEMDGFYLCTSLKSIELPERLTYIGHYAFTDCQMLESLEIPAKVTEIHSYAFENCSNLRSVTFAEDSQLESIEYAAFVRCKSLEGISLPDAVSNVEDACFQDCISLEYVKLSEGLERISAHSFQGCISLKSVDIPSGVKSIETQAFDGCKGLETVSFSEGLESLASGTFGNCTSLKKVILPDSLLYMVNSNFGGCEQLEEVVFGSSMDYMQDYNFILCPSLKVVDMTAVKENMRIGELSSIGSQENLTVHGTEYLKKQFLKKGAIASSNKNKQNYEVKSNIIDSYLNVLEDGSLEIVEYCDGWIWVENYMPEGSFTDIQVLPCELSLFGGYYYGEDANYLLFGEYNVAEDDAAEVYRIVKYDKDWNRIDSASIYGGNTTEPFDAGTVRMVESGDYLYIHTCHEMYRSEDGLIHQKNLSIVVDTNTMEIASEYTAFPSDYGFVGHSFNQFIITDGADIITADHGDANPRAVVLHKYIDTVGSKSMYNCIDVNVLHIQGLEGDNETGVSVGGLEASAEGYLVAGNSIVHNVGNHLLSQRNIFVTFTDKENFTEEGTTLRWITSCENGESVSTPHLTKISDTRYLLMWTVNNVLQYMFLDGKGNPVGEIFTDDTAALSDCKPIHTDGFVRWYVASGKPTFYYMDVSDVTIPILTKVKKYSIEDADFGFGWYHYTGEPQGIDCEISYGSDSLEEGIDYTISFENNINAGVATAIITGIGRYEGIAEEKFEIQKAKNLLYAIVNGEKLEPYNSLTLEVGDSVTFYAEDGSVLQCYPQEEGIVTVAEDGSVTAVAEEVSTRLILETGESNNYEKCSMEVYLTIFPGTSNDTPSGGDDTSGDNSGNTGGNGGTSGENSGDNSESSGGDNSGSDNENSDGDTSGDNTTPPVDDEPEIEKKQDQTIKVSKKASKTVVFKAKKLKKKSTSFSISAKAKGKITYSVTKYPKSGKKYIKVSKAGKVTLKKKAKKGTYVITVTAAKTSKYNKATRKVTIKIK